MAVDLRDIALEAAAEVQSLVMEFQQEILEPQMMSQMKQLWAGLPDEMKTRFAEERPEEYAALMRSLKGDG